MQAILSGRPFATAVRARRFLAHIVEEKLAGRTDGIKELVLGIEVFDRPAKNRAWRIDRFDRIRRHYGCLCFLTNLAAAKEINALIVCDPEEPRLKRAGIVKRFEFPIGLEQRVLNDILAVQNGSGHA